MEAVDHTKHGAIGHRVTFEVTESDESFSREMLKAAVEGEAVLHCASIDGFPLRGLVAQALPGKPGTHRWSAWVRVIKRPAEHPWNEERRLRSEDEGVERYGQS